MYMYNLWEAEHFTAMSKHFNCHILLRIVEFDYLHCFACFIFCGKMLIQNSFVQRTNNNTNRKVLWCI